MWKAKFSFNFCDWCSHVHVWLRQWQCHSSFVLIFSPLKTTLFLKSDKRYTDPESIRNTEQTQPSVENNSTIQSTNKKALSPQGKMGCSHKALRDITMPLKPSRGHGRVLGQGRGMITGWGMTSLWSRPDCKCCSSQARGGFWWSSLLNVLFKSLFCYYWILPVLKGCQ